MRTVPMAARLAAIGAALVLTWLIPYSAADAAKPPAKAPSKGTADEKGPTKAAGAKPAKRASQQTAKRSYTGHDWYKEVLDYNRRTLGGAYRRTGKRDPAWNVKAESFLEVMARYFSWGTVANPLYVPPADVPTNEQALAAGKSAVDAGCDDPLVLYCYGTTLEVAGRRDEAAVFVQRGFEGLASDAKAAEGAARPAAGAKSAAHCLWAAAAHVRRLTSDPALAASAAAVQQRQRPLVALGKLSDFERRYYFDRLLRELDAAPRAEQTAFVKDLADRPGADPWIRDTLAGWVEIRLAWDSRGAAEAAAVTDEGWQGFHEHLGKARDLLTRAWNSAPHLPQPASHMITVAMGAGEELGEKEFDWFERATAAQVDYPQAYENYAYTALLPRWGGSYEQILEVGQSCLATGRFDTDVPWQFVRAVQTVVRDSGGDWGPVLDDPAVYASLMRVFDGYVKSQAPRKNDAWFRSAKAAIAWRAGRHQEAAAVLKELGGRLDPQAFAAVADAANPSAAVGEVLAMAGPHAKELAAAEREASSAGDARKALTRYRAVAGKLTGKLAMNDPVSAFVNGRLRELGRAVAWEKGEWMDFQPAPGLPGWRPLTGRWEVRPDGSLTATGPQPDKLLMHGAGLGQDFELAGRVGPVEGLSYHGGGLMLFSRANRANTWVLIVDKNDRVLVAGAAVQPAVVATAKEPFTAPHEFLIRVTGGTLTVEVNGNAVMSGQALPALFAEGMDVALGGQGGDGVVFTKLKARKLPPGGAGAVPPPGPPGDESPEPGFD